MSNTILSALLFGLVLTYISISSVTSTPVNERTTEIPVYEKKIEDPDTGRSLTVMNLMTSEDEPSMASSKSSYGCRVMCNAGRGLCQARCGVNKRYCCCVQCEW